MTTRLGEQSEEMTKERKPIYYDEEGAPVYQSKTYCSRCHRVDGVLEYAVEGRGWVRNCHTCGYVEKITGE